MPRKTPELDRDFNIYVDPSCLSEPMEDDAHTPQLPTSAEEVLEQPAETALNVSGAPIAEDETEDAKQLIEDCACDGAGESPAADAQVEPAADPAGEEHTELEAPEGALVAEAQEDSSSPDIPTEGQPPAETGDAPSVAEAQDDAAATSPEPEAGPEAEAAVDLEQVEEKPAESSVPEPENQDGDVCLDGSETPESQQQQSLTAEGPAGDPGANDDTVQAPDVSQDIQLEKMADEESQQPVLEPADAPKPTSPSDANGREEDRAPGRSPVDRKTSLRTEALIQAAARAVVAKIAKRDSGQKGDQEDDEFENSMLNADSHDMHATRDDARSGYGGSRSPSRQESSETHIRHVPSRSISSDEGGSNSSHNEPEDDVFSDRSARSSVCSLDPNELDVKTPQAKDSLSRRDSYASSRQSPRTVSGFSTISGLSQYDKEQFVPVSRETRMPFRTPSEIRAIQMSSPTPSVFNGSSPRSSKRNGGGGSSGFPPVSHLSSPIASAQYSPKGRSTPPRFKSRKEAPLVLLHVTLLPLRWVWGDVVNSLDAVHGKVLDETGQPFEASEQLKTLRDSWRQLQDRVGDTVLERGVLLPHPQNDYEVLEERLLEALELPLRRRARILECGHYLGPSNEMADEEDESEDDDDASQSGRGKDEKRHWCNTCRNEIRYEHLGPGKVFRIKVYASNGLMKAGAWEACWKEMERVDVEVEPIVDSALQNELEKLGALLLEQEERRRQELDMDRTLELEQEQELQQQREPSPQHELRAGAANRQHSEPPAESDVRHSDTQTAPSSSRPPSSMQIAMHTSSLARADSPAPLHHPRPASRHTEPIDTSEARRRRDEERLREIYGGTPPPPPPPPAPAPAAAPAQLPAPPQPHPDPHLHHHPSSHLYSHALTSPPLLTDGSSPSSSMHHHTTHPAHPHHNLHNHYQQQQQQHHHDPHAGADPRQRAGPDDETPGFVELLMEAFKVLLRDPKNVAIIVLAVTGAEALVEAGDRGGEVEKGDAVVEGPVPAVGEVLRVPEVESVGAVDAASAEVSEMNMEEQVVVVEEPAPPVQQESVEVEVLDQDEQTAEAEDVEASVTREMLAFTPLTELFVRALALPTCSVDGGEDEGEDDSASDAPGEPEIYDDIPAVTDTTSQPPESPEEHELADLCGWDDDDTDNDEDEGLPLPATPSASAPTSATTTSAPVFVLGPLVTSRTTVRVFETVTETVRVSVVTQTETVSTVVTAVPQTVEETVFETETVRITVSVPVEEKKREGTEKKGKGKGSCGRFF
ncbi:5e064fea-7bfd-4d8c-b240-2e0574ed050c [Thermothielavioides terrestris]|uniref:5e064fea-7bfd-4d8c-b240-2e0574ed050c n=1 Tax=Thermothielavioides terrestris TaxID=2587410 RepID=A0A3S4BRH1_9PEZI|nr:5e064fea-7bfd-4d8c-b240-2e0574ed050c [Thermothielavioides terrestris]